MYNISSIISFGPLLKSGRPRPQGHLNNYLNHVLYLSPGGVLEHIVMEYCSKLILELDSKLTLY